MPTALRSRPWQSRDDTRAMQLGVSGHLVRDWPSARFHPGDVDWWVVQDYGRVPGITERVRLWFDGPADRAADDDGELVGYGWFSMPSEVDFFTISNDPAEVDPIVAAVVAWADERRTTLATAEPQPLKVWAAVDEPGAGMLQSLGLVASEGLGFVHLTGDLDIVDAWDPPSLPDGLTIRPMTDDDVASRVVCGHAAFPGSTMTVERYRTTFDAWLYKRDLDLLMVDPEGRVVAFTIGWLDPVSGVVELEPVGVHPEFHRRGLGREICRAVLRRARELGATRAVIGAELEDPAPTGLYQSLGLRITNHIVPFARPLAESVDPAAETEDELAAEAAA